MRGLLHGTLLAGCLLVVACRQPPTPEVVAAVQAEQEPKQEGWQVDYRLSIEGRLRARLLAAHLIRQEFPESTYVVLEGTAGEPVRGWLFTSEGDSSATLRAQRVIYYENTRRFEAEGDVEVFTREGKRLLTDRLRWLEDQQQLYAPGFVRLLAPDEQVAGFELEADEQLRSYRLHRVTGRVMIEETGSE